MMLVNLAQARFSDASSTVETSDRSSSESEQSTPESTDSSSPEIPNRPNLAEDEFVQLDVDNLVEAEPSADQPRTETPSCGREFYCVMVEKPNQAEYDKTRQLVADAYLREFPEIGQVLQVGAFKRESEAKNLQKRLDQRGITATIYYP
ncbi:SPOR domain-containing protein [Halothece sp. PCC 7418]|uniref:SPOR domain-containing protein n=1 Tax=Halothece sp. (strain PCC 7418) TaxID=65093 RepID=UPI0002EC0C0D|nr:SPOR domain-containing protein [Halothece sp. PCC 7418]